jgi:hypothetical protein
MDPINIMFRCDSNDDRIRRVLVISPGYNLYYVHVCFADGTVTCIQVTYVDCLSVNPWSKAIAAMQSGFKQLPSASSLLQNKAALAINWYYLNH